MFKNHFIHSQQCIKKFLHILPFFKPVKCVKIDLYPRHMDEKTLFMHIIVQRNFKKLKEKPIKRSGDEKSHLHKISYIYLMINNHFEPTCETVGVNLFATISVALRDL